MPLTSIKIFDMKGIARRMVMGASVLLCSCATTTKVEYVDREVVRYETKALHDTLKQYVHDSVSVEKRGDTVYVDRWHTEWRDRVAEKTDTCWRDSVHVRTIKRTAEKKIIPKWCYFSLAVCAIFVIFAVVKATKWLQAHLGGT